MLAKQVVKVRPKLMTALWAVPVFVSMASLVVVSPRRVGVKALIQLANGGYMQVSPSFVF